MLDPETWLDKAKALKVGEEKRTTHFCGPGLVLKVGAEETGWKAWCFRCNERGWVAAPPLPLSRRLELQRESREADLATMVLAELPEPRLPWSEWPMHARLWLLKAGLGAHEAGQLGAYYHPPTGRVVVPVLEGGRPVFWQARSVDGRQPKYIAPIMSASKVVPRYGKAGSITLTEDLLSAFKVGLAAEAWCLMGTSLKDNMLAALLADGRRVNVWLDPDDAGRKAMSRIVKQLRTLGIDARPVHSERDPKLHHRAEIQEILS